MARSATDGFLVLHRGRVALERYGNDMTAVARRVYPNALPRPIK